MNDETHTNKSREETEKGIFRRECLLQSKAILALPVVLVDERKILEQEFRQSWWRELLVVDESELVLKM